MVMAFAARGPDVMIASRKLEICEQPTTEVQRATGRRAIPVADHAGNFADSERLADLACDEFGKVDIVVGNAGISPLYKSVDSITEELYGKVLDVNLKGPFRLSALPGPLLTDISKAWDLDAFQARARSDLALGRGGEPSEIIGAALYLASDASSYTTGALIDTDGGPR